MANPKTKHSENLPEEVAQNAGARTAEINANPNVTAEETENARAGEQPSGSGGTAPSTVESHVPSQDSPYPTDLPSGNHPDQR
ncbi:MAG: hypothetical protein WAN66_12010 [Limnoraphis robusta]|uniref:Mucin n=1 Tax=Limnoraphis robusta CS-951 TaxID=1637645 RepID=A0A0F5YM40_9CYAN|nr:hypothetical protein [Limnoraphis robusta]KKD39707.1 mucin [Limnoraphis robusta CS-951]MEA5541887.1 hypothetical protein [Limnoraphis robusta Tam1]